MSIEILHVDRLLCLTEYPKLKVHVSENVFLKSLYWVLYEPHHEKTCLCHMRTTKVQISLISTFVVCYLDSIVPLLAIVEISRP